MGDCPDTSTRVDGLGPDLLAYDIALPAAVQASPDGLLEATTTWQTGIKISKWQAQDGYATPNSGNFSPPRKGAI
jgi:hypothetical protein